MPDPDRKPGEPDPKTMPGGKPAEHDKQMPGDGNADVLPGQHGNDSVPGKRQDKPEDDRLRP